MNIFVKNILFPITIFIVLMLMLFHLAKNKPQSNDSTYLIKSYKNTVALYQNEKIVKVYENIVLNTLPQQDILNFNKGIKVSTPTQAEIYLEDFEN